MKISSLSTINARLLLAAAGLALLSAGAANGECCATGEKTDQGASAPTATCCATGEKTAMTVEKPAKYAVIFHADWCGSCKALAPKVMAAKEKVKDKPVLFVTLDLTNDATKAQAVLLAKALGLGEIYAAQGGKTGVMLIVDGKTGDVVETINRTHSTEAIVASLEG